MKNKLLNKGLPKWPALIVKGKPVTKEQAEEILIRTDSLSFCSNDRDFEAQCNEIIYGVKSDWMGLHEALAKKFNLTQREAWDKEDEIRKQLGCLGLTYLGNRRILSSWIGGPHGWCNWNGYIGTNNYNIGKWPSVGDVYNDWKLIAKTFPYLDLRCQLLSGETCEEAVIPVVEYVVKNGKVRLTEPKEALDYPNDDTMSQVMNIFSNMNRERGCSISQLKEAVERLRK